MNSQGRRGLNLDYAALHDRYLAGESGTGIAKSVGIDQSGLMRAWHRRGLPVRSQTDAKTLLHAQRPELNDRITKAQDARRGNTDPMARREARAQTRERLMLGTSADEDRVAGWLDGLGIAYIRQKAVGPYNVDFAIPSLGLVLEVSGGGHNPRVRANAPARRAFLAEHGWRYVELEKRRGLDESAVRYALHESTGAKSNVPLTCSASASASASSSVKT